MMLIFPRQVYYFYTYSTAGWLGECSSLQQQPLSQQAIKTNNIPALQAAPLITSPTMIVALLSPEVREATSTFPTQPPLPESDALQPLKSTSPAR
jgi:hypothetical protein